MEFIRLVQKNGGIMNGSTRFDFTNYFEIVPSHKLETVLWAEADRMRGLDITQDNLTNQQGVVGNEVKVNVLNQPYGGFPWLDMPQIANQNWYNAHNFYGDLKDIEAATLEDVKAFFKTYYAPNNAALVVVGDFDPAQAKEWITKYFADIPSADQPAKPGPDQNHGRKQAKKVVKTDSLANRPALAFAYHMPENDTPEYYAMGVLDQILLQGDDSMLRDALVQKTRNDRRTSSGGINLLGNMFNYHGPMLWMGYLFHDSTVPADSIMAVVDSVIEHVRTTKIDQATVEPRPGQVPLGFPGYDHQRCSDLAVPISLHPSRCSMTIPSMINTIEGKIKKVTPELIQRTAQEYLRPTNQTVLSLIPKSGS